MRIRKRCIDGVSSTTEEKGKRVPKTTDDFHNKEATGKEFLLPLLAAIMDVQAKAQAGLVGVSDAPTLGPGFPRIHTRPELKLKDALLVCDSQSEDHLQVSGEGEKAKSRQKGKIRSNQENKFGLLGSKERTRAAKMSSEETIRNDNPKTDDKQQANNLYAGSQCRRRNGRGWRCSQRTLVGYLLCEHHLGKGRFKSINGGNCSVVESNKGGKFKELHLIHAAATPL